MNVSRLVSFFAAAAMAVSVLPAASMPKASPEMKMTTDIPTSRAPWKP